MSIEDLARLQVARQLPPGFQMQVGSFPSTAVAAMKASKGYLSDEEAEYRDALNLRPDGYAINSDLMHVLCIEIEDTNPLSRSKLEKYTEAWCMCDYEYWLLRLWTTDRYGKQIVEHNLCTLFYDFARMRTASHVT